MEEDFEEDVDRKIKDHEIIDDLRQQQERIGDQIRKEVTNAGRRRNAEWLRGSREEGKKKGPVARRFVEKEEESTNKLQSRTALPSSTKDETMEDK